MANRQAAARVCIAQLVAAVVAGGACAPWGVHHALAAWLAGTLVAASTVVMASRALVRARPGMAVVHLLVGMVLRWVIVLGGMLWMLVGLGWPPVSALAGLVLALLAPLALYFSRSR